MPSETTKPILTTDQPSESHPEAPSVQWDPTQHGPKITQCFEIYGANALDELDFVKSLGFNQVILDLFEFAKPAESRGLSVVLANSWNRQTSWRLVRLALDVARDLTRLVSINLVDEPIRGGLADHSPVVYQKLRRRIRRAGYVRPLSLTMYGPQTIWPTPWCRVFLDYLKAVDILRIDPYPIVAGKPLRLVGDWIHLARLLMASAHRVLPLTVVIEAWDSGVGLPSIDQIRVMAYIAMFSGADTLSFYDFHPATWYATAGFVQGFTAMMSELTGLAREFADAKIYPILGADDLFQVEIDLNGRWSGITVNTLDRPNGRLGPCQIIRREGRCPRPLASSRPQEGFLPLGRRRLPSFMRGPAVDS
jgi:hypothetical protein